MQMLQRFLRWIAQPDVRDKIVITVMGAASVALFWWVLNHAKRIANAVVLRMFWLVRGTTPLDETLNVYRTTLDRELFNIQHAWMKEGQKLKDILVPVIVQSERLSGGIEDWSSVLARYFGRIGPTAHTGNRRLAIIGGPGSGKSVALKLAAREVWNLPAPQDGDSLIPVLITFSEYRRAEFNLIKACCVSLRSRGLQLDSEAEQEAFVRQNLEAGRLFVIVDALDELEQGDRRHATERLSADLRQFSAVCAMISCRTAAWHNQMADIGRDVIEMSDFTPAAIRQFLKQWDFPPPKTSDELIDTIESQPHIAGLARSPLMLTIIAFLYAQPKYHLPQNRAEFYDICSRALLEEWDQHQNPDRANRFERHHKEYVLSEIAYRHMSGSTPDADLDERATLQIIAQVMKQYSLKESENLKLLDEIQENSGLLIRLPPSGLRFPHQTFLEFFAALWLIRQSNQQTAFEGYANDALRWREVLLLYIGLNTNAEDASNAVVRLEQEVGVEMALSALVDSRAVKPAIAAGILVKCEKGLQKDLDPRIITLLGYVAADSRTAHSQQAVKILRDTLERVAKLDVPLKPAILEALLIASLRRPSEKTSRFIVENLHQLQLTRILPQMGERAFVLTAKVIGDNTLADSKKREWIEGLRLAIGIRPLIRLLLESHAHESLTGANAEALFRLSRLPAFAEEVERVSNLDTKMVAGTAAQRWGWPFSKPASTGGRQFMMLLANAMANSEVSPDFANPEILNEADPRLLFLADGLRREQGKPPISWENGSRSISLLVLKQIWSTSNNERWRKWIRGLGESQDPWLVTALLTGFILPLWCIIAYVCRIFSGTYLGLRWYTGFIVFGLSVATCTFTLLRKGEKTRRDDFLLGAVVGPMGIAILLAQNRFQRWTTDIVVILATVVGPFYLANGPIAIALILFLSSLQAIAYTRVLTPRPSIPIFANDMTWNFCKRLTLY